MQTVVFRGEDMKLSVLLVMLLVPLTWGIGGFLGGVAEQKAQTPYDGMAWITFGYLFWMAVTLVVTGGKPFISGWEWHWQGIVYGLAWSFAGVMFVIALRFAPVTNVIAYSALYPVVTFLLALVFLGETFTWKKTLGIILAFVVGWLMS
jgi:drug/metabolite transporter (DMT)-like permease